MTNITGTATHRTNSDGMLIDADGHPVLLHGVLTTILGYAEPDPADPAVLIVRAILEAQCPNCGRPFLFGLEPGESAEHVFAVRHDSPGTCKAKAYVAAAPRGHELYERHCVQPENLIRVAAKSTGKQPQRLSRCDLMEILAKHAPPSHPDADAERARP